MESNLKDETLGFHYEVRHDKIEIKPHSTKHDMSWPTHRGWLLHALKLLKSRRCLQIYSLFRYCKWKARHEIINMNAIAVVDAQELQS